MGFEPCKMEPDIQSRPYEENHYEYVAICEEGLLITSKDPKIMTDVLTNKYSFKLKGAGLISYHLGCAFDHDDDDILRFAPKNHVETMVDCYCSMFGIKPKLSFSQPLEQGDFPELDTSEQIDSDRVQKC